MTAPSDSESAFIVAACVPLHVGHSSGTLEDAEAVLAAHPEVGHANVHTAAILADDVGVRRFLEQDPANATAKGGPHDWDALTHLCFSRYLKLDPARSDAFVRAARALLEAGASANTGWTETRHQPKPEWEPVLYGAAGIAHHAALTRLLLDYGANANDGEVVYHSPETYDNDALKILVESGKLTADSLAAMLLRKADWHDTEGITWLLEHGADPDRPAGGWGITALHNAVLSDNSAEIVELMMDHGADPLRVTAVRSAKHGGVSSSVALAARRGRGDLLELFERREVSPDLQGVERLLSACARNNAEAIRLIAEREPQLVADVLAEGGALLATFAGVGNTEGVRHLLDLGVPVDTPLVEGNGYWGLAKNSTALHVAAWRARHATVKRLIERGALVNARDADGRTPLALAVRACVDSYWSDRRSPESVEALLRAGALVSGVAYPSGYAEVDALLGSHLA